MKKIGLIAAMTKELEPLLAACEKTEECAVFGGKKVLKACVSDKELYIIESGVGEIYAAAATQFLITAMSVEAVINFGVCGSLSPRQTLKKTVFVQGVVHYEMDTTAIDDLKVGQYSEYPSEVIPVNAVLLDKAKNMFPEIEAVLCASGNKFIADKNEKEYLYDTFKTEVCEMESAGILLTCNLNKVPCLMVKAVSDADGGAGDFLKTVHEAARVYISLVMKLASEM